MSDASQSLLAALQELWRDLQDEQRVKWNRSLPLAEGIVDRWSRAEALGFGTGTSIYDSAVVIGDVRVGSNTWIGPNVVLDGSGGLYIGDNCSISAGAQLYSHSSVDWAITGGEAEVRRRTTRIGDRCYVGPNSVIEAGTEMGQTCIVGAFSLVRGTIPDRSKMFGVPARRVGQVEMPG